MRANAERGCAFVCCIAAVLALSARTDAQIATYRISRTSQSPKIDGRLDDVCWKSACAVTSFGPLGAGKVKVDQPVQTKAFLTYDADCLYVAYICEEPLVKQLVVNTKDHDGPTWQDDAVEIFFNPSGDRERYCQIAVNAAGVVMDNYGALPARKLDMTYETGATAATEIGADKWTLEVRIPFAGLPVEELDCAWTFHLARHRAAVPQLYTSLRSPVTGFHSVESFDVLEGISLKERRVAVLGVSLGDMLQGTNLTRLTLKNESASAVEVVVAAGIEGAAPPCRVQRKVSLKPGAEESLNLPWELMPEHAGQKEFLSVSVAGKVIQRRERVIAEVPPIFGNLPMSAYYLDPNEFVRLDMPIQLAAGSRGEARLEWTATNASDSVVGSGLTTVYGTSAVVRLYWPRWADGRYTVDLQLSRKGQRIASRKEVVRLVQSPWGGF